MHAWARSNTFVDTSADTLVSGTTRLDLYLAVVALPADLTSASERFDLIGAVTVVHTRTFSAVINICQAVSTSKTGRTRTGVPTQVVDAHAIVVTRGAVAVVDILVTVGPSPACFTAARE